MVIACGEKAKTLTVILTRSAEIARTIESVKHTAVGTVDRPLKVHKDINSFR